MAHTQDTAPQAAGSANAATAAAGGRAGAAAAAVKAGPVLPWMRVPITIEPGTGVPTEGVLGMDKRLVPVLLNEFNFKELFPVQTAVWQHSAGGRSTAHDLCVAAPTGSGKTLAYALPVVNELAGTTAHKHFKSLGRLQALVVLPTRDLAAQVYDVFRPLCEAVGLKAVLAAARSSEAAEAAQLLGTAAAAAAAGGGGGGSHRHLHQVAPGGMAGAAHGGGGGIGSGSGAGKGGAGADVVVATPGRLMAHLSGTPGFTLEHLRFLVVDETDRLLRQSYQEWLPRVLSQLSPQHAALQQHLHVLAQHGLDVAGCSSSASSSSSGHGGGAGGGAAGHFAALWPGASTGTALPYSVPRVVKIVVSATLTRDPAKLQRLALHHPRYVATAGSAGAGAGAGGGLGAGGGGGGGSAAAAAAAAARYSLPRSLSEYRLLCSAARKPLALLALLADASAAGESVIVFTSSLEMTHKLYLMLSAVPELAGQVVEYSSHVAAKERAAGLERFRKGAAKVLVASDAMTRGMDVDCVQVVINYDAPVYAKTYVHRAGRTARAGKSGRVVTLLRDEDMRHFKAMIRKADNNFVRELKLPAERVESFRPALAGALQQLEALLAAENRADAATAAELLKQQQQQQAQQQQQRQEQQRQEQQRQEHKQQDAGEAQAAGVEKEQKAEAARQAGGEEDDENGAADGQEAEADVVRARQKRGREDDGDASGQKRRGGTHKRSADTAEAGQQETDEEGGRDRREGKRKQRRAADQSS